MKKIFALVLVLTMAFALSACQKKDAATEATAEPTLAAEETTAADDAE